jgi:ubiquinone/menaquinone biosynthesis C-methylase UbiE
MRKMNNHQFLIIEKFKEKVKKKPPLMKDDFNIPDKQDLDLYWNNDFVNVLETWGEDHVWNEIELLLANVNGKILDIACGTGRVIEKLTKYNNLEVHGIDISDLLIEKALMKNISKDRLTIGNATKTNYPDNSFDFSYSIGSLEHFTCDGIDDFLSECSRFTKIGSFHMIPISKSNHDEGWLTTSQSFFNNSENWWLKVFSKYFQKVYKVKSSWSDNISYGRWFLCYKQTNR